ncbi:MAG: Autotransporter-associated beta strand repeat protein [Verrucomicrobia bacterium]|nr:Autotransporter-associated beta strand repeat protein [Verrucomicrobiota bacterium]
MKPRFSCSVFRALLVALFAALNASAQTTFTWTGGGANDDINNPANWLGGTAPTGVGGEDLVFAANGDFLPAFNSAFSIHNFTVTATSSGYNFTGTGPLTITGDIEMALPSLTILVGVPIVFSAGNHIFSQGDIEVGSGDIYFFGDVGGAGNISKYGAGTTVFDHFLPNTMTGTVDLIEGRILVHNDGVLGTGLVKMDGGVLEAVDYYNDTQTTTLPNNFSLSGSANFGEVDGKGSLVITGTTTAQSGLSLNTVYVNVEGDGLLTLTNVGETTAGTLFRFERDGATRIAGTASYTGGTKVFNDAILVFANGAPTTGLLQASDNGYIGTEVTTGVQANFLARFDTANSDGIIGFDSPNAASPQTFSEAIDLTIFPDDTVRIGTNSAAILSGPITIDSENSYYFSGRGILTVTSNLTETSARLEVGDGLQLFLRGNNTYYGTTLASSGGAVIFDSAGAMSPNSTLSSSSEGYIGETENSGLTTAQFFSHIDVDDMDGVVGLDAHDPVAGRTVSENIDMSVFNGSSTPYLGTSTKVTLTGTITPDQDATFRFTGFRNGQLTVDSTLTGAGNYVNIGLDVTDLANLEPANTTYHPTVTLNGTNTYGQGTGFYSGALIVSNSSALGTGPLEYFNQGNDVTFSTSAANLTFSNVVHYDGYGRIILAGTFDYTFSGAGSGYGNFQKTAINTVTFSGDNSGLTGFMDVVSGKVKFTADAAAGVIDLYLQNFDNVDDAQVIFTSANPSVGSISGDDRTIVNFGSGNLTTFLNNDSTFNGHLIGSGNFMINEGGAETPPTLTLTNHNPGYTGTTTLLGGSVAVTQNDSLGSGGIVFNGGRLSVGAGVTISNAISFGASGGTLGGNGTFAGHLTIGAGALLGPGNSVGFLTFTGGQTWGPGGAYQVEVQAASGTRGAGYDTIDVTGGLTFTATLGSPFTFSLVSLDSGGSQGGLVADFDSSMGYSWLIAHSDSLSGFAPANVVLDTTGFGNSLGSGAFHVVAVGNDVFLNFTPVPEPSTYALLGGGLALLLIPALRRRK